MAAADPEVLVVGTVTKLFWAGLRVGWIRAPDPIRDALVQLKAARDLASSVPSQLLAAALLGRADTEWLRGMSQTLEHRRDQLAGAITERLPAWRIPCLPSCGLSLWVQLPVANTDAFTEVGRRHGVTIAPASAMCLCRKHRDHLRLSFAEPPDLLDLAAERLATAWEAHCEALASAPG
jgi:DNA-binding transcriptional MocR family regulator